jgi:hypothetical protein
VYTVIGPVGFCSPSDPGCVTAVISRLLGSVPLRPVGPDRDASIEPAAQPRPLLDL